MSQRVPVLSLFKRLWRGSEGKPSLNRAFVDFSTKERAGDPKPGELAMTRVSPNENWEEARTRRSFNILG